jgi:hypothetical protein
VEAKNDDEEVEKERKSSKGKSASEREQRDLN